MSSSLNLVETEKLFRSLAKKAYRKPSPKKVHQLRVLTRKLRVDLWLTPKSAQTGAMGRVQRKLEALSDVLGEQRMYDVAVKDAKEFGFKIRKISKKRKKARSKVTKVLKGQKRRKLAESLKRAAEDSTEIDPTLMIPKIEKLRGKLAQWRQHPPRTAAERHKLRIKVKKARYLLGGFGEQVPKLEELQDHLGRWHDLMVLEELVGKTGKTQLEKQQQWELVEREIEPVLQRTDLALQRVAQRLIDS